MRKKVFVSGCFDMFHSGHVRFLEEAAAHGDLYVGIGSDQTVKELKGRSPVTTQDERKYILEALKCVKKCSINSGSGTLDFIAELEHIAPDIFVVNEDGNTPAKAELCRQRGLKYVVLKRVPRKNLPARSTTSLRRECNIPYRLDLAGGWLDQRDISRHAPGPVITVSIEPTLEFNQRSGMASSTRIRAIELWQTEIPVDDRQKLARVLFSYENPPGTEYFSGSQDSIGIVYPALNRLDYDGAYWPGKITSVGDENILKWLEEHLYLVPLGPRNGHFNVFKGKQISTPRVRALAVAANRCWDAILKQDVARFGRFFRESFEAQTGLFPAMATANVRAAIKMFSAAAMGWKLAGAGGGGYLVLVSQREIPGAIKIKIRRNDTV